MTAADTTRVPAADSPRLSTAVRYLAGLHGSLARPVAAIAGLGVLAGLTEAAALLAFVRATVVITSDGISGFSVRGLSVDFSPGSLIVVALVFAGFAAAIHVLLARASAQLSRDISNAARDRLIDAFFVASWSHVARYREGRLQETISRMTEGAARAAAELAFGLSSLVICAALGIVAVAINPLVSLALLAIPALIVALAIPLVASLRRRAQENVVDSVGLAEATAATATLAREYRTFGVGTRRAGVLKGAARAHADRVARTRRRGFMISFLFKDVALIVLIGVVGLLYLTSDLREGTVIASVLLVIRLLGYIQQAFRTIQDGMHDAAMIGALRVEIEGFEANAEDPGTVALDQLAPIVFEDVHYAYEPTRPALVGVDLRIEPNTTVGLVGPSGAGKSTIAEVLLGLRRPAAGRVLVGGIDLADVRRSDWSRLTALVPQDQLLAAETIAENIAFLRPWVTREMVVGAARRAHVDAEIAALPDGYDHVIGTRSRGLSGGQRQRVAIARALAGSPQLLVLDEPTSALDAHTEQLFRQTLDELHGTATIIVIAHRPATLEACDVVVRIAGGRVVAVEPGRRTVAAGSR